MSIYEEFAHKFDRSTVQINNTNEGKILHTQFKEHSAGISITLAGDPCSQDQYNRGLSQAEDFSVYYHAHDCFFLAYVVKGENLEIIEGNPIVVTENDLLMLTPYTRHHNLHTKSSQVLFIHIEPKVLFHTLQPAMLENILFSDFFSDFLLDNHTRKALFFKDSVKLVQPLLEKIIQEYLNEHLLYHSYIQYLFGALIIELARYQTFQPYHFSDTTTEQMKAVLSFITKNYQNITLEDMAKHFGYHPSYLSRKIRQFTGKTYSQLLSEYRLSRAVILLNEKRLSVEEIAYSCGYKEISTFYKAFTKKYHCSPRDLE